MSSYASVYFRGVEIFSWRDEVDPTFLFLFTSQDVRQVPRSPEEAIVEDNEQQILLTATAAVLRDRLDVLGIGRLALEPAFDEIVQVKIRTSRRIHPSLSDHYKNVMQARVDALEDLTLDKWAELFGKALKAPEKGARTALSEPDSITFLIDLWEYADPRLLLRAVLLACDPEDEITLGVSDVIEKGWLYREFDPQSAAIDYFGYALANGSPAVVITEGSTDAQFLQVAIRICYPHLKTFIKFFDFADGAEGSAGAGVRTLKSFVAAGISNRVVLLLDNDAAARDALRALKGSKLPSHYSVRQYPDLESARRYPTMGPSGLADLDVNGLAASIEMYLGADVLADSDGNPSPVQWRSYIQGVEAYQGELMNKAAIQKRFRQKVKDAEADPNLVAAQDWSGLKAIIDDLIAELRG